jgi:hypothetical protein
VLYLAILGECLLEALNLFSKNEGRVLANAVERRLDLIAQQTVLGFQVEVGDGYACGFQRDLQPYTVPFG